MLRIRIRDPGVGAFLTPGSATLIYFMISDMVQKILSVGYNFITSGMGESQYPDPGSGIRDEQAWSYFLKLRTDFFAFFEVKILC